MTHPKKPAPATAPECATCLKPESLCVCQAIQPQKTRLHVLILQHPQEPDKDLGSARLAHLALPNSTLKIGLSWPNISKALGRETTPSRWAVLYLGSGVQKRADSVPSAARKPGSVTFVDKKGVPLEAPPALRDLDGLIVLDGTWSQAKTLWWRNAWLLKAKRVILTPKNKSLYKELRREPRGECLSTIESVAECLDALNESPSVGEELRGTFARLLDRKREEIRAKRVARPGHAGPGGQRAPEAKPQLADQDKRDKPKSDSDPTE